MNEREFWIQMRRGLLTVIAAIADGSPLNEPFWAKVAQGFGDVVCAIDERYDLPHSTRVPIGEGLIMGTFTTEKEPPAKPLARTHIERNGAN